jgi:hypothetical protein
MHCTASRLCRELLASCFIASRLVVLKHKLRATHTVMVACNQAMQSGLQAAAVSANSSNRGRCSGTTHTHTCCVSRPPRAAAALKPHSSGLSSLPPGHTGSASLPAIQHKTPHHLRCQAATAAAAAAYLPLAAACLPLLTQPQSYTAPKLLRQTHQRQGIPRRLCSLGACEGAAFTCRRARAAACPPLACTPRLLAVARRGPVGLTRPPQPS